MDKDFKFGHSKGSLSEGKGFDAIIIGAGISGLICGNYLQQSGYKTLLLENSNQVGGNMAGFRKQGFYFDCGCQSLESLGILFPILKELKLYNPSEWMRVNFRVISPDCDICLGNFHQVRKELRNAFPESAKEIDRWFNSLFFSTKQVKKLLGKLAINAIDGGLYRYLALGFFAKKSIFNFNRLLEAFSKTSSHKARENFSDTRLVTIFGDFAYPNMILIMYYMLWESFVNDYWYPTGGMQRFLNRLAEAYVENGGTLQLSSRVDEIIIEGKTACGVKTADGAEIKAKRIIHTGNYKRLIKQMTDINAFPYSFKERVLQAPTAPSVTSAFLGVDMSSEELGNYLNSQHTFFWRDYRKPTGPYDAEYHKKGLCIINWTSYYQSNLAPPQHNSLVIQVLTPYHWQNGWATKSADPEARNAAYRKLKNKVLDDIISSVDELIPGLKERVVFKDLATPRSLSRITLNEEGSTAGWSYDLYQTIMFPRFFRFGTPFKNLYQAGHYSIWPGGVISAALSAKIVAKQLDKPLLGRLILS